MSDTKEQLADDLESFFKDARARYSPVRNECIKEMRDGGVNWCGLAVIRDGLTLYGRLYRPAGVFEALQKRANELLVRIQEFYKVNR